MSQKSMFDRREYFSNGIIEAEQHGRHIKWKNAMNEEDYTAWREQLRSNHPLVFEEIQQITEIVTSIVNKHDKIFLLAGIAAIGLERQQHHVDDDAEAEIVLEYCLSICTAFPNYGEQNRPTATTLKILFTLCSQLRDYLSAYYAVEHLQNKLTENEYKMRFSMINEKLHVRGDGYLSHLEEVFKELFSPHDDFFVRHYGFNSYDIVTTLKQLEASFCLRVASPDGKHHPHLEHQLAKWKKESKGNEKYPEDFVRRNPGVYLNGNNIMIFPINWLPYHDRLFCIRHYDKTQALVAKALSIRLGDNTDFIQFTPFSMLNPSKIYTYPIVEISQDEAYFFAPNVGARNYFNIAQHLIRKADQNYYDQSFSGNRLAISKDSYIEQKVMTLFKSMLPGVIFHANAHYTFKNSPVSLKCTRSVNGNYEVDLLGVSEKATYLIEVKAGLVGEDSRRGAIKTLKTNLSSIVGDAICQAYRAQLFIESTETPSFQVNGVTIVPKNRTKFVRVSVSFSYVGNLLSSLLKLQQSGIIDAQAKFAWTINLFDLMPVTRILHGENSFLDYIDKRLPIYSDPRLQGADEMQLLGLYLHNDLRIDAEMDNMTHVQLNGYADEIDAFFDRGGPKPVKKRGKKF